MTIICAQRGVNGVWIGSDSLASSGGYITPGHSQRKWYHSRPGKADWDGWWVGLAGSESLAQAIVQRLDKWDLPPKGEDLGNPYWTWQGVRNIVAPMVPGDQGGEPSAPLIVLLEAILVGAGQVYRCWTRGVVSAGDDRFMACGAGENHAEASAWTIKGGPDRARDRVQIGLEAACAFNALCGGELFIKFIADKPAPRAS